MNFYELLNEIVDKIARNYDLSSDEMISLDFIRAKLIVVITIVSSLACSTLFLVYLLKVQSFNFSLGLILFGGREHNMQNFGLYQNKSYYQKYKILFPFLKRIS